MENILQMNTAAPQEQLLKFWSIKLEKDFGLINIFLLQQVFKHLDFL